MKSVRTILLVIPIVACAPVLAAMVEGHAGQVPARDTSAPRAGTGRITGRVLAADTGAPVRRAIVRLSSSELREGRATMTDGEGKYEFGDLPSGSYNVLVQKSGFLTMQLGARQPDDPGKPLKVAEAETVRNANVVLVRGAAITGRVVDEFGDPVAYVGVRVLRYRSVGGSRRLTMVSAANTNDLGQYRAAGLQPGSYYIEAQASTGTDVEVADHAGYAPTYYPGTPDPAAAQPVQVTYGQDATNVDIMLSVVRTSRVSGIALDSQGRPATTSNVVAVMPQSSGTGSMGYGRVQPDGTFTVPNLPPGEYVLTLTVARQSLTEWAQTRVAVSGSDVAGLTLQASQGATIAGRLVFEGTSSGAPAKMTVNAAFQSSVDYARPGGPPAQVREDGTFTLTGVFGERVFRVSGASSTWALKAVYLNGRDITDTAIAFEGRENMSGLQIVLTDRVTHLTATVNDDRGQPAETAYVIVFPEDEARWSTTAGSRFQRAGIARDVTPLKIDALPPADYIAVALPSAQNVDPWDPEFLGRMRKAGVRFSLGEGESKTVALKLIDDRKQ